MARTHTTHLTGEEMPEPGSLRRVVRVDPGNRLYETVEAGHEPGWYVNTGDTAPEYWTDNEVSEVHDTNDGRRWVVRGTLPAAVLSRHGQEPEVKDRSRRVQRGRPTAREQAIAAHEQKDATTEPRALKPGDKDEDE